MLIVPCLAKLPWHYLFTINPTPTPLLSTSHLHLCFIPLLALFFLILLSCTIVTILPSLLQRLFFLTHINMPCMYQYSPSLILKLFLSYFFILLSQSLNSVLYPPQVIPCGIHGRGDGLQKFQMDSMEWWMDSILSVDGFHGMVDGFHGFSTWIPWFFHMDSILFPHGFHPFPDGFHMEWVHGIIILHLYISSNLNTGLFEIWVSDLIW